MTRERFQELIYIHEEIDDLRTKIVDLTRAKKESLSCTFLKNLAIQFL